MSTAFQSNAFQNNAFQIDGVGGTVITDSAVTPQILLIGQSGDLVIFVASPSGNVNPDLGGVAAEIQDRELRKIYERDKAKKAKKAKKATPLNPVVVVKKPIQVISADEPIKLRAPGSPDVLNTAKPEYQAGSHETNVVAPVEAIKIDPTPMSVVYVHALDVGEATAWTYDVDIEFGAYASVDDGFMLSVASSDAAASGIVNPTEAELLMMLAYLADEVMADV